MTINFDTTTVLAIGLVWLIIRDWLVRPAIVISRPEPMMVRGGTSASPAAERMTELLEMRQKCGCPGCKEWLKLFIGEPGEHGACEKPEKPGGEETVTATGESAGHYL